MINPLVFELHKPVYYIVIEAAVDGGYVYKCTRMKTRHDLIWAKSLGKRIVGNENVVYYNCHCLAHDQMLRAFAWILEHGDIG